MGIILDRNFLLLCFYFLCYFRYFEGHLPILVTSDLEIIQEVFIKQNANFSARKVFLALLIASV